MLFDGRTDNGIVDGEKIRKAIGTAGLTPGNASPAGNVTQAINKSQKSRARSKAKRAKQNPSSVSDTWGAEEGRGLPRGGLRFGKKAPSRGKTRNLANTVTKQRVEREAEDIPGICESGPRRREAEVVQHG